MMVPYVVIFLLFARHFQLAPAYAAGSKSLKFIRTSGKNLKNDTLSSQRSVMDSSASNRFEKSGKRAKTDSDVINVTEIADFPSKSMSIPGSEFGKFRKTGKVAKSTKKEYVK
mmetsp:Transcript_18999/g.38203  ORF Transcript_18999/g.38203 Transcript_18999/m.38203 type:complete len:113 (-) Transcript_18999:126-464(-)